MAVWKENGVWVFKVTVTDGFGNKKQIKRQSQEWNRRDAQKAERDFLSEVVIGSSMKFSNLADAYIKWKSETIKKSSVITLHSNYISNIKPYFGDMAIDQIDNRSIMLWQSQLLKKDLDEQYLVLIQSVFKSMLGYAAKMKYLQSNPFILDYVRPVKTLENKEKKMTVLDINQFMQFVNVVDRYQDEVLYNLLFFGGLRVGEALVLRIEDFDPETGKLTINKTLSNTGTITTPKTSESNRVITLNKALCAMISKLIESYANFDELSPKRFIFGYDKPMPYYTLYFRHEVYMKRSGLPRFKIHSLRHSCVSTLISLGIQPLQIAKRTGHSVKMVTEIYGHLLDKDDQMMAESMEKLKSSKNLVRLKN